MGQTKTLKKLRYAEQNSDNDELKSAYEKAVMDYKRAIMYHAGTKLWHSHRSGFREHKKYYGNQQRKPFNMLIIDFNTHMKEFGASLCHLPPLSLKKGTRYFNADWDAVEITKKEIWATIYNALPKITRPTSTVSVKPIGRTWAKMIS